MSGSLEEIDRLLRVGGGVVARRDNAALSGALDRAIRLKKLESVLPGVYASPDRRGDFAVRVRALATWNPNAVLVGAAAAKHTFWPELTVPLIEAAGRRDLRRAGYIVKRRVIPADLIGETAGVRCTTAALTALDLCLTLGGNAIDTVLRSRAATLDQLHDALALTPWRRGNGDRRQWLLDSRGRPWSEAERALHRLLHEAGIEGWKGNFGLEILTGTYWIDVAFPELKLAIEVDGFEFHSSKKAFESDRWRQNDLVLAGWRVLRFTAIMLRDQPEIVLDLILRALAE